MPLPIGARATIAACRLNWRSSRHESMPQSKPFGAMNELNPTHGLHVLKKRFHKKYMREQSEFLLAHVDEVIHHTFRLAPVRLGRRYLMDHSAATPSPKHREAK